MLIHDIKSFFHGNMWKFYSLFLFSPLKIFFCLPTTNIMSSLLCSIKTIYFSLHPIKLVQLLLNSNQLTYTFIGHGYLKMVSGSGSCVMTQRYQNVFEAKNFSRVIMFSVACRHFGELNPNVSIGLATWKLLIQVYPVILHQRINWALFLMLSIFVLAR